MTGRARRRCSSPPPAASGEPRVLPLIYGRNGDDYLIVASKGGADQPPAWYVNLKANPEVEVQVKGDRFTRRRPTRAGRGDSRRCGGDDLPLAGLRRLPAQDRPGDPGRRARTPLCAARAGLVPKADRVNAAAAALLAARTECPRRLDLSATRARRAPSRAACRPRRTASPTRSRTQARGARSAPARDPSAASTPPRTPATNTSP